MSKTLAIRIISALVGILIVLSLYFYFGPSGLKVLCLMGVFIGSTELLGILFKKEESLTVKAFFIVLLLLLYLSSSVFVEISGLLFALTSIVYFSLSLIRFKRFDSLSHFFVFQANSILGFFYFGLLPSFVTRILDLPRGTAWFFFLLTVIFAGDATAYFFGVYWGKKKILPEISPKKTFFGAFGGLCGSLIAAAIFSIYFPNIPLFVLLLLSLMMGLIGQTGDLFESMMKRVAHVKDSGQIMPGHGGILDRIDGVLFASPLLLFFILYFEKLSYK